jgi:hypothetical protein
MKLKPDCGSLPWLAAILTIVGAGGRVFIPAQNSFISAFFFGIVVVFALMLAYLGWQCNAERQLPSSDVCKLLLHLDRTKSFNGTPAGFNVEAQKVLYSD